SPSTRIAWLVRVVPARGSTRRPALMTTVTDGTAAAAGATGACAVSGTTAAASALRAAAGRTLLVMTTSEETTKEWRLGKLCTSREVGGGGVASVTRESVWNDMLTIEGRRLRGRSYRTMQNYMR